MLNISQSEDGTITIVLDREKASAIENQLLWSLTESDNDAKELWQGLSGLLEENAETPSLRDRVDELAASLDSKTADRQDIAERAVALLKEIADPETAKAT